MKTKYDATMRDSHKKTEYAKRTSGGLHDPGCASKADCGGVFRCSKCKRTVGFCVGVGESSRCTECMPEPENEEPT